MPDVAAGISLELTMMRVTISDAPAPFFPSSLEWLRRFGIARVDQLPRSPVIVLVEASPVQNLEPHQMKMDGM